MRYALSVWFVGSVGFSVYASAQSFAEPILVVASARVLEALLWLGSAAVTNALLNWD